jgi:hypothetical protein
LERTVPYFAGRLQRAGRKKQGDSDSVPMGDFPFIERRRAFTEAGTWTDRPAV